MITQVSSLSNIISTNFGYSPLLGGWLQDFPLVGYLGSNFWAYGRPRDFSLLGYPRRFILHRYFTTCFSSSTLYLGRAHWARRSDLLCLWLHLRQHLRWRLRWRLRLHRQQPGAHVHHEVLQLLNLLSNASKCGTSHRFDSLWLPPFYGWRLCLFILFSRRLFILVNLLLQWVS